MQANEVAFCDAETEIAELIGRMQEHPVRLSGKQVGLAQAARAQEGEVWSPQLLPYETWASAAGEESDGAAGQDAPLADGTLASISEADLLRVGVRSGGGSEEWRAEVLARAVEGSDVARPGSSAVAVPEASRLRMIDDEAEDAACGGTDEEDALRGVFAVREEPDGYALVAADLRRLGELFGNDDLVVALPAYVGDVPVVRIAAEAFARRFVQGVGVRLLLVPDTVERVDARAFSVVSAGHVHLGRNVERIGEQPCDLSGLSPRLGRRTFSVAEGNTRYRVREGSLFTHDGRRLLFLAPPYADRLDIPEGVEQVDAAALCEGVSRPGLVRCGADLARVASREFDDAVWLCPEDAPARAALAARDVRMAGHRAVERDGCWYDFDAAGAVLVAGPAAPRSVSQRFAAAALARQAGLTDSAPSAAIAGPMEASEDALVLPRTVDGAPLVRIAARALPWAPATLVLPDTVRVVDQKNFCRTTKRLVLPEGLEKIGAHSFCSRTLDGAVSVPASVSSVGEGCFEYALVRFERTGSVVHVSADQLLTCFMEHRGEEGVPFDFAAYDELLRAGKNLPDGLGALLHRVADPAKPSADVMAALIARLDARRREAQQRVARDGDAAMVAALLDAGFINEETFDAQIELLRSCNRTDCVLYLMEERHKRFGAPAREEGKPARRSARDRFAL